MNQFRETLFEHFNLVHIKITFRITKKMVGKKSVKFWHFGLEFFLIFCVYNWKWKYSHVNMTQHLTRCLWNKTNNPETSDYCFALLDRSMNTLSAVIVFFNIYATWIINCSVIWNFSCIFFRTRTLILGQWTSNSNMKKKLVFYGYGV